MATYEYKTLILLFYKLIRVYFNQSKFQRTVGSCFNELVLVLFVMVYGHKPVNTRTVHRNIELNYSKMLQVKEFDVIFW